MEINNVPVCTIDGLKDFVVCLKRSLDNGKRVNLLVESEAGIGKSQVIQQLSKELYGENSFTDLRLALCERPDILGLAEIKIENGHKVTSYAINEMLPQTGKGILCFEEINRADVSVTNTVMQLLTESKVNKTEVAKDWLFVALINPDTSEYHTNVLDAALENRFVKIKLEYSQKDFLAYIKEKDWDYRIVNFIEAGLFEYRKRAECNNNDYVSPRSWEYLNNLLTNNPDIHNSMFGLSCKSSLGINTGTVFINFCIDLKPVTFAMIKNDCDNALSLLRKYSSDKGYRGDLLRITIRDVSDNYSDIDTKTFDKVIETLPLDIVKSLILLITQKYNADINTVVTNKKILKRLVDINDIASAV